MLAPARHRAVRETSISDDDDEGSTGTLGEFEKRVKAVAEAAWRGEFPTGENLKALQRENQAAHVR